MKNYRYLDYDETPRVLVLADGRRRWTNEEDTKLLKALSEGHTFTECDKILKCSRGCCWMRMKTLKNYGNKTRGAHVLPPDVIAMIKSAHDNHGGGRWNRNFKPIIDFVKSCKAKNVDDAYVEFRNSGKFGSISFWNFYHRYKKAMSNEKPVKKVSTSIRKSPWGMKVDMMIMKECLAGKSHAEIAKEIGTGAHNVQTRAYYIRKQKSLGYKATTKEYAKLLKRFQENLGRNDWTKKEHNFVMNSKLKSPKAIAKAYNKVKGFRPRSYHQVYAHLKWHNKV